MNSKIFIKEANAIDFPCDVLVLKFAQRFYGVDALVSDLLKLPENRKPKTGEFVLLPSQEGIAAKNVLFVGVVPLSQFDYEQIRAFSRRSLQILAEQMPDARHIAMTIHGVGYGLDEKESFLAQLAGLFDAFRNDIPTASLSRITIIERDPDRAARLKKILKAILPSEQRATSQRLISKKSPPSKIASAGFKSKDKPHIFVAMPFGKQMLDVYRFGIQDPVNAAGFLCERMDMEPFIGDILTRIKSRIETATLIIADLTGVSPNVYLEVGYAWGKDRPTLLLAQKKDELKFDVQGQKCIIYETIGELKDKLEKELTALKPNSQKR